MTQSSTNDDGGDPNPKQPVFPFEELYRKFFNDRYVNHMVSSSEGRIDVEVARDIIGDTILAASSNFSGITKKPDGYVFKALKNNKWAYIRKERQKVEGAKHTAKIDTQLMKSTAMIPRWELDEIVNIAKKVLNEKQLLFLELRFFTNKEHSLRELEEYFGFPSYEATRKYSERVIGKLRTALEEERKSRERY
jgi:hypothetical protein